MTSANLNQSAPAVTLDADGNGTTRIGPVSAREWWSPAVVSVRTNQAIADITSEAACRIFCGSDTSEQNYVDGTLSGSTGDSTGNVAGQEIQVGQYIWAQWTGGDPGAQAWLNVSGTKNLA